MLGDSDAKLMTSWVERVKVVELVEEESPPLFIGIRLRSVWMQLVTTAAPPISPLIRSILALGLMLLPPVLKGDALADEHCWSIALLSTFVMHFKELVRLGRALSHTEKRPHAPLFRPDLVSHIQLHRQPCQGMLGLFTELSGCKKAGRGLHQPPGEVLSFAKYLSSLLTFAAAVSFRSTPHQTSNFRQGLLFTFELVVVSV